MWNNTNPAEIYASTTWELLPDNKFLKTGSTPLQQAGSNNISISKANLPTDKLQVESFSLTRGTMDITGQFAPSQWPGKEATEGAFYRKAEGGQAIHPGIQYDGVLNGFQASRSWTGSTSSASPYTTAMGDGTPISINPEHITVRAWKRLT